MNDLHAFLIQRNNKTIGYLSMDASFQDVRKLLHAGYLVIPNKENQDLVIPNIQNQDCHTA